MSAITPEYTECLDWIFKQQATIEGSKYGNNYRAVKEALDELSTRLNIISDYRKQVDSVVKQVPKKESRDTLERCYKDLQELCRKKINTLNVLLEIASAEEQSGLLSSDFDLRASLLVEPDQRVKLLSQDLGHLPGFISPSAQEGIFAVRDSWRWMQSLMKCTGIHLKNAAQYHQFFQYMDEMQLRIGKDTNHLLDIFLKEQQFKGDYADAKSLLQQLDDLLVALRQWETKTTLQWDQATRVLPVHLRTEGVTEPTPIRALCEYETKDIHVRDGEDLLLINSSDATTWQVRNCKGQEADVPAVICLIPGPYMEAINAALSLRLKLIVEWTEVLKKVGSQLITFMLVVFKPEYNADEIELIQSLSDEEKSELEGIMQYIEDTLKPHWVDNDDFQLLQERLLVLRLILNDAKDKPRTEKPGHLALVVQMTMIEKLVEKYKLLERDRYKTLIQLILHETKLQQGDPVRQEVWRDWLTYKSVLESVRTDELMLIVHKWEKLSLVPKMDVSMLVEDSLHEMLAAEDAERLQALADEEEKERLEKERKEREERERKEREEKERKEREAKERKEREERERKEREERERKEREEKERKEKEEKERKEREAREKKEKEEKERKEREERERKEREEKERKEREAREKKEKEEKERKEREERERKEKEEKERKEREAREKKEKEEKERKEREERERKEREERERKEREAREKKEKEEKERKEKEERERKERKEKERKEKEERDRKEREEKERKEREERERKEREARERKEREERERKEREEKERKEKEEKERIEREERERKEREEKERKEREERERKEREERERKEREERERKEREERERKEKEERERKEREERERKEREERERQEKEERERKEREEQEKIEAELALGAAAGDDTASETSQDSEATKRRIAETEEIASSEVEERKTFVITSVFDPRTGLKISLTDAIKDGIIIQEKGLYINPITKEELFIPMAMNQGLIQVGQTKVKRTAEKKSSIGLITVRDPDGLDEDVTYAVSSVVDAKTKTPLTFQQAVERGIIVKEKGAYLNTATEEAMEIGDAISRGLIRARQIADPRSLDIDPKNIMVANERAKKNFMRSLSAVSAFRKAASMENLSRGYTVTKPDLV